MLQSAPAGVVYDPDQRGYRIAVGAAFGEYEEEGVNCDGAVGSRERRFGLATAPGQVSADSTSMSNRVLRTELGRVGVGYRLSQRPRFGFRINVGVSDFPLGDSENRLLLDALVRVPVSRTTDLGVLATLRDRAGGNLGLFRAGAPALDETSRKIEASYLSQHHCSISHPEDTRA